MQIIIITVVIIVIAITTVACGGYLSPKYKKAISIAQEYLNQKYDQEMVYKDIRKAPIDPGFYYITFLSTKPPEIEFEVVVYDSLTIPEKARDFGSGDISADNYYLKVFEYLMNEHLDADVNHLWGGSVTVHVRTESGGLVAISSELNDNMPLDEMESIIDGYWITITEHDTSLENKSLEVLAKELFDFIQIVNNEGFTPECITYYIYDDGSDLKYIRFNDIGEIDSVTQIMERLESEFGKYMQ